MKQFKRMGGDDKLGHYTEWERNSVNGCIYCGSRADTREHTPSKAFLTEPFPDNLPTVPACFKCNNGFSFDEDYVACYLDVLKSTVYSGYSIKGKVDERLQKQPTLNALIKKQIELKNGKVKFHYDESRFINVLIKLARSHAGYEFDYVNFDYDPDIWYDFRFRMSEEQIKEFNSIAVIDKMPDLGARVYNRLCIVDDPETGKILQTFLEPVYVQEGEYRYNVYFDNEDICVKIVIGEILYCVVRFE